MDRPPEPDETEALIARARGRDREALDALLGAHRSQLLRIADAELGTQLRAHVRPSDIVQSTLLDVVEGIDGFRGHDGDAFRGWLTQVLRNNVLDTARFFSADRRDVDRETSSVDLLDLLPRETPSPSALLSTEEELDRIGRALARLSSLHRRVLVQRMSEKRTHEEIAAELGKSVPASRQLLARARAALALELDQLRENPDG